jgi:hypothetical protein
MLSHRVHLGLKNMCVGAKHDRNQYEIISNNLYAVMLLQASKTRCTLSHPYSVAVLQFNDCDFLFTLFVAQDYGIVGGCIRP